MRSLGLVLLALPLIAQPQASIGLVHGSLLESQASGGSGELTIRTADNQILHFAFDDKTYFERDQEHSAAGRLEKDDWLEIVSDQSPDSALRYARTVHVIEPKAPARLRPVTRAMAYRSPVDPLFPRGDLTFSGVVERLNGERLVLHTRTGGEKSIQLRQDTSFIAEGDPVDSSALEPNMRVFVRAGINLDNQIEAYQVIWGEILEPAKRCPTLGVLCKLPHEGLTGIPPPRGSGLEACRSDRSG